MTNIRKMSILAGICAAVLMTSSLFSSSTPVQAQSFPARVSGTGTEASQALQCEQGLRASTITFDGRGISTDGQHATITGGTWSITSPTDGILYRGTITGEFILPGSVGLDAKAAINNCDPSTAGQDHTISGLCGSAGIIEFMSAIGNVHYGSFPTCTIFSPPGPPITPPGHNR